MTTSASGQAELFGTPVPVLPEGMVYERDFLAADEENDLVRLAAALPLHEMNYKGYTARRRVASYGGRYDFATNQLEAGAPLPAHLEPLRERVGRWLGVDPQEFTQVLVAEYRPGTPLGWHRDVPDFEDVVGVSLLGEAVMKFRPYPPREPKQSAALKVLVERRSIYLLRGPARWAWQHSVAPTQALRYSITFRTPRRRA
jgi:alkylated DNA repair dioxygenase AlkB